MFGFLLMEKNLLTLYGLGKLRFAGSIASLIATLYYAIPALVLPLWALVITMLIFIVILTYSFVLLHRNRLRLYAPKEIVVDEFAGTYICLMVAIPDNMNDVLFLFLVFRALDLLKLPPFSWLEESLPPHWAIIAGDIAIGLTVGLLYGVLF